jgi:hypothetical protein
MKQRQRQESRLREAQIAQTLGLTNDPVQTLSGLVNVLNSIQAPGVQQEQFGQELGLKERELAQRGQMADREQGFRELSRGDALSQFAQEIGLKREMAGDERQYRQDALAGRAQEATDQRTFQQGQLEETGKNRKYSVWAQLLGMLLGKESLRPEDQAGIAGLSQMMELPPGLFGPQAAQARPGAGYENVNLGGPKDADVFGAIDKIMGQRK